MAGLYIHIPFCKQACSYCNFHFSTRLVQMDEMVDAIINEMILRADYLKNRELESVYFGGGTPSLLSKDQLTRIWLAVNRLFKVRSTAEVTLEANPDDLTQEKLKALADSAINRLSIGIQSFRDSDLQLMHRAHSADQALQCLQFAFDHGFDNITVDLIYGLPDLTDADWAGNLAQVAVYPINHLSCYALTVESKTQLSYQIKHRKIRPPSDEQMAKHFNILMEYARNHGFTHYEISNFARDGYVAVHNSNYWKQQPYLGIGPSAHSYDGQTRSWNIANNAHYLKSLARNELPSTEEVLTTDQQYNEYIMTGLRTIWGCNEDSIHHFGESYLEEFIEGVKPFFEKGWMIEKNRIYLLTDTGKLFADYIASELFIVEED